MNNEIYRKVLVGTRDSADGETATILSVTEEANCFAVWEDGYFGRELIKWFSPHDREKALEFTITELPVLMANARAETAAYWAEAKAKYEATSGTGQ